MWFSHFVSPNFKIKLLTLLDFDFAPPHRVRNPPSPPPTQVKCVKCQRRRVLETPQTRLPGDGFQIFRGRGGNREEPDSLFPLFLFPFFPPLSSSNWLSESRLLWRLPRHWSTSSGRLLWEPRRAGNQGQQRCGGRKKRERGERRRRENREKTECT